MNFMNIVAEDMVNAPGIHVAIWVSGCPHHCPGCFNPESWSYTAGQTFDFQTMNYIIDAVGQPICSGLTILGGEPLAPNNVATVWQMIENVKNTYPDKDIWVYSGYTIQELYDRNDSTTNKILKNIDVLVDGRYIESKRFPGLRYRGSTNQRVIDVKATLATHEYNNIVCVKTGETPPEETLIDKVKKIFRRS